MAQTERGETVNDQCSLPIQLRGLTALLVAVTLWPVAPAIAYPNLQLYSPQGTYVAEHPDPWVSESWLVPGGSFDVWLVAWHESSDIYDIRISLAVPEEEFNSGGSIRVSWAESKPGSYVYYPPGANSSGYVPTPFNIPDTAEVELKFNHDDIDDPPNPLSPPPRPYSDYYVNGTPILGDPITGQPMAPHGVYPTWFGELWMGTLTTESGSTDEIWNSVSDDGEGVHWVEPDEFGEYPYDTAPGVIYKLHVEIDGFSKVQFDAHDGLFNNPKHYKTVFCPFSHNLVTPEPGSMVFMGAVFAGAVARRIRTKRRRKS